MGYVQDVNCFKVSNDNTIGASNDDIIVVSIPISARCTGLPCKYPPLPQNFSRAMDSCWEKIIILYYKVYQKVLKIKILHLDDPGPDA